MAYVKKEEKIKRRIKKDLLEQLNAKGLKGEHYVNLVEDYMFLYKQKSDYQEDIRTRGVIVTYINSKGFESEKKNESCDMILKTNQQMLKLLDYLGIKPSEHINDEEDDNEL